MFNNSQPLWMPEGSVRAIIALFTVITIVLFFVLLGGEVAVAALAGTLGSVITWYFTNRDKQAAIQAALYTPVPPETEEDPVDPSL